MPTTTTWKQHGETYSRAEPELDWIDVALLGAWADLKTQLCPSCGRPKQMHNGQTSDDYRVGYTTCPAVEALNIEQAAKAAEDEEARKGFDDDNPSKRINPDRARTWFAWTADEGPPT